MKNIKVYSITLEGFCAQCGKRETRTITPKQLKLLHKGNKLISQRWRTGKERSKRNRKPVWGNSLCNVPWKIFHFKQQHKSHGKIQHTAWKHKKIHRKTDGNSRDNNESSLQGKRWLKEFFTMGNSMCISWNPGASNGKSPEHRRILHFNWKCMFLKKPCKTCPGHNANSTRGKGKRRQVQFWSWNHTKSHWWTSWNSWKNKTKVSVVLVFIFRTLTPVKESRGFFLDKQGLVSICK